MVGNPLALPRQAGCDMNDRVSREHVVVEQRTIFVVRCGGCSKTWEVRGARHDDLSAFDLEDGMDESCPHCGVTRIVLTGDAEADAMLLADVEEDVPCRATFERWAAKAPEKLMAFLLAHEPVSFVLLGDAAEVAGNVASDEMRRALESLLSHESLFVREGAVYGLREQLTPELRERLTTMLKSESSDAVRAAIEDVLS